jgi:hypothetical protein
MEPHPHDDDDRYEQQQADFHNVAPRTREERLAANDKDTLEKMRLDHRRGGHNRFDGSKNPLLPDQNSLSYMSEADRFGTDAASEEYDRRQRKLLEKEVRVGGKYLQTLAPHPMPASHAYFGFFPPPSPGRCLCSCHGSFFCLFLAPFVFLSSDATPRATRHP